METNQNIGIWTANVSNEGKTPLVKINGTFPTKKGEKPYYHLERLPVGFNPTELRFKFIFGHLVDANGEENHALTHSEPVETVDKYKTIHIVDDSENERTIANINIENS